MVYCIIPSFLQLFFTVDINILISISYLASNLASKKYIQLYCRKYYEGETYPGCICIVYLFDIL